MVSFQDTPITQVHPQFQSSSKKRKWDHDLLAEQLFFKDQSNSEKRNSVFDSGLQPHTPFTSDKWRQYLTIQSGQQIQSVNRTTTTTEDSKRSLESRASNDPHVTLDLELNLTCESQRKLKQSSYDHINEKQSCVSPVLSEQIDDFTESSKCKKEDSEGKIKRSPSWLSSSEGDCKEMVATVCMKCHMLVMLCKSSPACPNCKFMHPPDQNLPKFLKRRCTLFC